MLLIKDLGMKDLGTYKVRFGIYKCPECKNFFETRVSSVKQGRVKMCRSCGSTKHGFGYSKLNRVFSDINQRCNNTNNKFYERYGARGIKNEFLNREDFYLWAINNGYKDGLKIDRIDNNGNYNKENCRWVTQLIQSRNTAIIHKNNNSGFRGVHKKTKDNKFTASITVNGKSIYIGRFNTALESAIAYDNYVIKNNLEHTLNGVTDVF